MFPKKKKKPALPEVRRLPGQSVRERWEQLMEDRLLPIVFCPLLLWSVTFSFWIQEASGKPPLIRTWLCMSLIATGIAGILLVRLLPRARALVCGQRGEMVVAEQLEELRDLGFRCFHDLVQDGFNVDHVVVGPAGVFVVETKYRSGRGSIEFRNGQGIFIAGRPAEGDALSQARGGAAAVNKLLREDAGLDVFVKSLVVFVGDWKIKNAWQTTDARVLSVQQLPTYFQRQDQPELKRSEIALICSHLRRSVKA